MPRALSLTLALVDDCLSPTLGDAVDTGRAKLEARVSEDRDAALKLCWANVTQWSFGTLPVGQRSGALAEAVAAGSGMGEDIARMWGTVGTLSGDDPGYLVLHTAEGTFKLFPFHSVECASLVEAVTALTRKEPYTEHVFVKQVGRLCRTYPSFAA